MNSGARSDVRAGFGTENIRVSIFGAGLALDRPEKGAARLRRSVFTTLQRMQGKSVDLDQAPPRGVHRPRSSLRSTSPPLNLGSLSGRQQLLGVGKLACLECREDIALAGVLLRPSVLLSLLIGTSRHGDAGMDTSAYDRSVEGSR